MASLRCSLKGEEEKLGDLTVRGSLDGLLPLQYFQFFLGLFHLLLAGFQLPL